MTVPAITVGPDTPFPEIVDQLLTHDISGLPVVDDDGRLLGVVTEADLVSKEAYCYRRRRALGLVADYLLEAVAARVPGVVGVENRLTARVAEPRLSTVAPPG